MQSNEIMSHHETCGREGMSLQRGMNFASRGGHSIVLSSHRANAPYEDRLEEQGTVLIYEGHDEPRSAALLNPKLVDQPLCTPSGRLTQNGLFHEAAQAYKSGEQQAHRVRVYEKLKDGIWSYNGVFQLEDSWTETCKSRRVFKFKLRSLADEDCQTPQRNALRAMRRVIPASVKITVWKRDGGACVECGAREHLHFDHILPYSKGGTSDSAENIQLLCMKHNLEKSDSIL